MSWFDLKYTIYFLLDISFVLLNLNESIIIGKNIYNLLDVVKKSSF